MTRYRWGRRTRALCALGVVGLLTTTAVTVAGAAHAAAAFSTTMVNQANSNCADVPGGAGTGGLQLVQWSCNSGTNQSFGFTPVASATDTYTISTVAGSCIDIYGGSAADNAAVIQYGCHSGTNQQFRLQAVPVSGATNTFNVISVQSGKCVAPAGDAPASNTSLVQLPCSTATSRVWRLPGFGGGTTPPGNPPAGTVRVFWLRPTDVPHDQRYPDGIGGVMRESQRFFKQQLGKTFTLNNPVVETVAGQHDTNWYINNNCDPNGDRYACVIFNMVAELRQRFGLGDPDRRWLIVGEVSAEEPGKSGGGGRPGWVMLSGHDADGAAGKTEPMPRWYGGMVHELGHAFGLPDASSTDGTCMSASFYAYPNCVFSQSQKNGMLNGPYGSFLT